MSSKWTISCSTADGSSQEKSRSTGAQCWQPAGHQAPSRHQLSVHAEAFRSGAVAKSPDWPRLWLYHSKASRRGSPRLGKKRPDWPRKPVRPRGQPLSTWKKQETPQNTHTHTHTHME